jgi:hypothetical protein
MPEFRLNDFRVMASDRMRFHYNEKRRVMIRRFSGNVSLEEVVDSLNEVIRNGIFIEKVKGLLLDCSNAHLDFSATEYRQIVNYFVENIDFFKKFKLGFVANTPHNIVIAMLIEQADDRYIFRPFTSIEAAMVWCGF